MALNKAALKAQIKSIMESDGNTAESAAAALADAIDAYVRTATVNTIVTGSSVSGGPVTGTGVGTLS